jgi:dihydroneopterin aldolase
MKVDPRPVVRLSTVSISSIKILADIGVLPQEIGRLQPLAVTVTLHIRPPISDELAATVDYTDIVSATERLGRERTGLIETLARRLAEFCLQYPIVEEADVIVEKPWALTSGLAGARVVLARGSGRLMASGPPS